MPKTARQVMPLIAPPLHAGRSFRPRHPPRNRPLRPRVGLWRTGFTVEEQREFFTVAGTLLEDLGYST
jgi:hypothetical protein